jgi:hypothetical protein
MLPVPTSTSPLKGAVAARGGGGASASGGVGDRSPVHLATVLSNATPSATWPIERRDQERIPRTSFVGVEQGIMGVATRRSSVVRSPAVHPATAAGIPFSAEHTRGAESVKPVQN